MTVAFSGREDFEATLDRTPFQNVDIYRAHAPFPHRQPVCLVKVDRARADERAPIVVDLKNITRPDDPELCPERPARPIRRGAHHIFAGKLRANGVLATASL